jgi:hypothetical protein
MPLLPDPVEAPPRLPDSRAPIQSPRPVKSDRIFRWQAFLVPAPSQLSP